MNRSPPNWDEECEPFEPTPEEQLHTRLAKVSRCRQRVVAELDHLKKLLDKYPELEDRLFAGRARLVVDNTSNTSKRIVRFRLSQPDGEPPPRAA